MEDAFSKYYKRRKRRISNFSLPKSINRSFSKRLIDNKNNNINNISNMKKKYIMRRNLDNNNSLFLPRIGDSFRIENGNNKYKDSFNSSFRQDRRNPFYNNNRYGSLNKNDIKSFIYDPKKISGYLDYRINKAIANKKMRQELEKKRLISSMKKSINEEFKKNRPIDDKMFLRELEEIEGNRENMKAFRNRMLDELKEEETLLLDDMLDIPPPPPPIIPPFFPNFYPNLFPQMMKPPDNNNDTFGDIIKFMLFKKLIDSNDNQLFQFPFNYFPAFPQPYFPPFYQINLPRKKPFPYPNPIIIQNIPYRSKKKSKDLRNKSSDSKSGKSFKDPLNTYLDVIDRFKKFKENNLKKEKDSSKKTSEEESNEEEDEENEEDEDEEKENGENEGEDNGGEQEEDEGDNQNNNEEE